jgi:hypothetical protein
VEKHGQQRQGQRQAGASENKVTRNASVRDRPRIRLP